ncbi:hypothetical protein PO002_40640 [Cupriavidus necator]|uniref:hypothetical protein n=1 Tax=Cupriavidus necator TaxID=106590 RepID=UPI0039C32FB6
MTAPTTVPTPEKKLQQAGDLGTSDPHVPDAAHHAAMALRFAPGGVASNKGLKAGRTLYA